MRSDGPDIVEFFGFSPDDGSEAAIGSFNKSECPFVKSKCSKINHDQSVVYGSCAVTGKLSLTQREEVIICPKRLYAEGYSTFRDVTEIVWGKLPVVVGGTLAELRARAITHKECIVAFGQNSGREITVNSSGKLSMDWVLQRYKTIGKTLEPLDFVGIEVQSIDTTGNYRDTISAYSALKANLPCTIIPKSSHGLNWANVHKRLIPQIIRKGHIYSKSERCMGFFFIVPEQVYKKFEEVLGVIEEEAAPSRLNLSVLTYALGDTVGHGNTRQINHCHTKHHSLVNIAKAFSNRTDPKAPKKFDEILKKIL